MIVACTLIVLRDDAIPGQIFSVSAAHSGRFACAYLPEGVVVSSITNANSIKVGVFECESSGGVEWLREDTLLIDNKPFIEQLVAFLTLVLSSTFLNIVFVSLFALLEFCFFVKLCCNYDPRDGQ